MVILDGKRGRYTFGSKDFEAKLGACITGKESAISGPNDLGSELD